MRRIASLFLLFFPLVLAAQQFVVKGQLQDAKTLEPLEYATASLLRGDSIVSRPAVADECGAFVLQAPSRKTCTLRFSYVGYQPRTLEVYWPEGRDTVDVGIVGLVSEDYKVGMATVTATAAKVEQKGDTTVFNASAYRVPEGSTLEALISQLPGVEVGDDGKITLNGKEITELLINGKDFFKGDTQVAMKNLPTNLVSKVKAYEKKSDYTEQTGIDDGEETSVLDISTKRALDESWVTNADLGYGTEKRYAERIFISRFTEKSYVSAYGNLNNVNSRGFGGPRGFGGGGGGLTSTKNGGMSFSWDNGRDRNAAGRFEIGGHVRAEHRSTDNLSTSVSETFLTGASGSSFSNRRNQTYGKNTSISGNFRLSWKPDSLTSVMLRPNFSYSTSSDSGESKTVTFDSDPYAVEGVGDPLFNETSVALDSLTVNRNTRKSLSDGTSYNLGLSMNVTRRLNNMGRNVNFRGNFSYSSSENHSYTHSEIKYPNSGRETSLLNQYTFTPSTNLNYSLRVGYAEPLGNNWFAEARYEFGYRYQDSDRTLRSFDYDSGILPPPLGYKPSEGDYLLWVRDENNSRYATYRTYNNYANAGVRYNSETIRFNAGIDLQPQTTKMDYERPGQHIDTVITRHVFHLAPTVRLRYNFSKTDRLELNYRGSSSEPSMTDLLAVVDDTDPLNISMGNPGLNPSWTNSFRAMYNGYNTERQQGIMGSLNFSQTSNSISSRMVYDQTTGVRYVRPDNINGNWNASGEFMFNTPLDYDKLLTVTTHTSLNYRNQVGYVSVTGARAAAEPRAVAEDDQRDYAYYSRIFDSAASQRNTTRTLGVRENLTLSYRRDWYDVSLFCRVNYDHSRATARDNANLDTWQYAYGLRGNLNFDWGMTFSTDLRLNARRGYADASMNTNEVLWNVQLSQSFLKERNAIISLQAYDLLRQQSSVSRTISALQRSDSWTNAIHSYFMLHFIYRLNIFGGSQSGGGSRGGSRGGGRGGSGGGFSGGMMGGGF
ncbi:MAG: outer membrane beta-barrel protein [Prevotellaceae bacterium]|nr:outer membrane beta-barrel protein [Prevotellaceae bacterium]